MRLCRTLLSSALVLACSLPAFSMIRTHRSPTSHKLVSKRPRATAKPLGQRSIDDERATQIQTALIGKGYLSGEATGHWDADTEAAMHKFQSDNGWQTKLIPDSRAIIKLGLGPGQETEQTATAVTAPSQPETTSTAFMAQQ